MIAKVIGRVCSNVNRVLYLFPNTEKSNIDLSFSKLTCSPDNIQLIHDAEAIVHQVCQNTDIKKKNCRKFLDRFFTHFYLGIIT